MAFLSCFVNAFTQLFACGTHQRGSADETNADAPYEATPKREPIVDESPAPLASENSDETEPDPVSIKQPRDENIASAEEIKLNVVDSETSPESVRDSLGILADHPFGCPDPEPIPQPLPPINRVETRLSLGSTSTAESIPQLVEETSSTTTSRGGDDDSAANIGRGGKSQLEKLKEKYRRKVDKAKREWELAQFKADQALQKMKAVAAKAEAAVDKMQKKRKAAKASKKKSTKRRRGEDSGKLVNRPTPGSALLHLRPELKSRQIDLIPWAACLKFQENGEFFTFAAVSDRTPTLKSWK